MQIFWLLIAGSIAMLLHTRRRARIGTMSTRIGNFDRQKNPRGSRTAVICSGVFWTTALCWSLYALVALTWTRFMSTPLFLGLFFAFFGAAFLSILVPRGNTLKREMK
jgi:hypothetical protein